MCSDSVRANDRDLILALDIASVVYSTPEWKEKIRVELGLDEDKFRRFYQRIEAHLRLWQMSAC